MLHLFKIIIGGLILLGLIALLILHLVALSTRSRAADVLAQVVAARDDATADMAARALIELKDTDIIPVLDARFDAAGNHGIKTRIVKVVDAIAADEGRDLLLKALGDPDVLVSSEAALALAKRGEPAVLDLARERLESDDPRIAGLSFEILGYLQDGFIDGIESELNSSSPDRMPGALRGLVPMIQRGNDRAWRLLKRAINSRFAEVRLAAYDAAVGLSGEKRAEALMTATTESTDPALRKKAIHEMANGQDASAFIDTLKLALNDDDLGVKFAAAWGLYKLRDPTPVPYMRSVLNNKEQSLANRIIAARLLARLGDPQGAGPMYDILDDVELSPDIKLEAAEVLGEYDEIKGMGYLGEAIKPDRPFDLRLKALDMLGIMGNKNAEVLLKDMASDDPDEIIAVRSAYAYTSLTGGKRSAILRRFLRSDNDEVRTLAAVGILTGGDITDIIGEEGYK